MNKAIELRFAVTLDSSTTSSVLELLEQAIERGVCRSQLPELTLGRAASPQALVGSKAPSKDARLLLDTKEVCELLGVSPRKVWSMQVGGEMPAPIRIGRAVRWSRAAITNWIDQGCPQSSG